MGGNSAGKENYIKHFPRTEVTYINFILNFYIEERMVNPHPAFGRLENLVFQCNYFNYLYVSSQSNSENWGCKTAQYIFPSR